MASGVRGSDTKTGTPRLRRRSTWAGARYGHTTARSGLSATMRSRSSPVASPTRGSRLASGGASAGASTPTMRAPAPAANSSSVACGARLTMRRAGADSSIRFPVASIAATGAARIAAFHATNSARQPQHSPETRPAIISITVPHADETRGPRSVVVGGELAVLVEGVVEPGKQRPAGGERVVRREIDQCVPAHATGVGGVVESRGRCVDFDADAQSVPGPADGENAVSASAARQQIARCVVFRSLQIDAPPQIGVADPGPELERDAFERRIGDVLRRAIEGRVALEHDEIAHAVAIGDDAGGEARPRITQRDFRVVRGFRPEIGVGKPGEVEVIECRRLEGRPVARARAKAVAKRVAVGERTGRSPAELRTVVASQVRLQRVRTFAPLPDADDRVRVARRHREARVAVHAFLASLESDRELGRRQSEIVLPRVLALPRLEPGRSESSLGDAVVVAFARFQPARPEGREPVATGDRIGIERRDRPVVEAGTRVELSVEPAVKELGRELLLGSEAIGEAAARAFFSVAVAIGVVAEIRRVADGIEAVAAADARLQRVTQRTRPARYAARSRSRPVR